MNRKIEFRGKLSHSGEWVFGGLLKIDNKYHIVTESDMYEDGHHICQESDTPTWVDPDTVCQFTGQYDKNDKEIYEGDIVECVSWNEYFTNPDTGEVMQPFRRKMIVEFRKGGFKMVEPMPYGMEDNVWDIICNGDIENIGNIYDNPELLSTK